MKRLILISIVGFWLCSTSFGQITSQANGAWNSAATWSCNCIPLSSDNIIIDDTVHIPNAFTALGASLVVQAGGVLRLDQGGALSISGQITFNDGSEYRHNQNGGTIPTASWQSGSNCRITGIIASLINGPSLNQSFHHFIWDSPGQTAPNFLLSGNLSTVHGDLVIENTGTGRLNLGSGSFSFVSSIAIAGNLKVSSGARLSLTSSGNYTVNVAGNTIIDSNASGNALIFASSGTAILNVEGDFEKLNTGVINLGPSSSSTSILNLKGNFIFEGGVIFRESSPLPGALSMIRFNGNIEQNYTGGGTYSSANPIFFVVAEGSVLNLANGVSILQQGGGFICEGKVQINSEDVQDAIRGNIPFLDLTFEEGSTISYTSPNAQFMGNSHPSSAGVTTRIENTSPVGVALAANVVIGGDLVLHSNSLHIGSNTLTLGGGFTPTDFALEVTPSSNLNIGGSGVFGNLVFSGSTALNNFTMNRASGNIFLVDDLTVEGILTQNNGTLHLNGNSLSINGSFSQTGGTIDGSANSSVVVQGAGSLPAETSFSGIFSSFELNRASSVLASNSAFEITNLNLVSGQFNSSSALVISDDGIINRYNNGSIGTTPGSTGSYNIVYLNTNPIFSGPEIPSTTLTAAVLDTLEVSGGGDVTLIGDAFVNGSIILSNGDLLCESRTITLGGNLVGNFSNGFSQSTLIFDGDSEIIDPPTLGNIQLNVGKFLELPVTGISVTGNITFQDGSFLSHNESIIELTGNSLQTIYGGEQELFSIQVNQSNSAGVQLTGNISLINELEILSPNTVFDASGHLTLISTSDLDDGNARIAPLLSGAQVIGDVTVQRYMSNGGRIWRYISSPVEAATVIELMDNFYVTGTFSDPSSGPGVISSSPSFYYYNESISGGLQDGWINYPTSGFSFENPLEPGRGYAAFIRNDTLSTMWDVIGVINQGLIDFNVTYTDTENEEADGWNLVGNPYPSSIFWGETGWVRENIQEPIAIRDNVLGNFRYWDGDLGDEQFTGTISTGQAFWVQTNGENPVLQVSELAKTTTGSFFRTSSSEINFVKIKLAKGSQYDVAYVRTREDATPGFDRFDAIKMENDLFDLSTLSFDSSPKRLAINAIDHFNCDQHIQLHCKDLTPGNYEVALEFAGWFQEVDWYLIDNYLDIELKISDNPYLFTITSDEASKKSDRFELFAKSKQALNLSIPIVFTGSVCNGENANIKLENTQENVYYEFLINENSLGVPLQGTGQTIDFMVLNEWLLKGENLLKIQASDYCTKEFLLDHAVITQVTMDSVYIEEFSHRVIKSNYTDGNQWYFNDDILMDETNQFLTMHIPGVYKLVVSTQDECSSEAIYIFEEESNVVSVYPNPATDKVFINLSGGFNYDKIDVVDNIGRIAMVVPLHAKVASATIDVSRMSSGLYYLRIYSQDETKVFKFVIK